MTRVIPVSKTWLLALINGYTPQVREAAGEANRPYRPLDSVGFPLPRRTRDLVDIAEAHWQVFTEVDAVLRADLLNALLQRAELSPSMAPTGDLAWTTARPDPVGRVAAACTVALMDAVRRRGWDRIGVCHGEDCLDAFIDEAGSSHRIYCSATCLNRAKVRAHRARHSSRR